MEQGGTMKKTIILVLLGSLVLFTGLLCRRSALISVYKSPDLGTTWEQLRVTSLPGKKFVAPTGQAYSLVFDLINPKIMFLGIKDKGIFKSTDGGLSWEQKNEGIPMDRNDVIFYRILINPNDSNQILAAGITKKYGKIIKSSDGGEHWREVLVESRPNYIISDLATNNQEVVASSQIGNVYESSDFGDSWNVIGQFSDEVSSISINRSGVVYISTSTLGAFKTADSGKNWAGITESINRQAESFRKINDLSVYKIKVAPSDDMIVYLASKKGIFVSRDGGISWENIKALLPPEGFVPEILALKIHPQNSNIIFYAVRNVIYKGIIEGTSWKSQQISLGISAFDIEFNPADSNSVYATAATE